VLRIYRNGQNTPRVLYEHAVLSALRDVPFSFSVPRLVRALDGSTFGLLPEGDAAACFELIAGGAASTGDALAIGRAMAELVRGLEGVSVALVSPNPLYREPWRAHWKVSKEAFHSLVAGPACDAVRKPIDFLVAEISAAEAFIDETLRTGGLPEQLIHADLHSDNWLLSEGLVTGALDWEFACRDWRVMELCVGLSKYAGLKDASEAAAAMGAFIDGYKLGGGQLTLREIVRVPALIKLRVLSNVIYFAGRFLGGEDTLEPLTGRAAVYASRLRFLDDRAAWLVERASALVKD
jgi:homoserine kinase type II